MSFFADTIEIEPETGFYVPDFLIEVEGKPLDTATKGDVLSIKLTLEIEKITSATVKLNNWNDQKLEFKYSDWTGLDAGNRVNLELGYVGKLVSLLKGQINSLAPDFPEKGASTLTIGVLDRLQLLKDRSPVEGEKRQFKGTDGEIAQEIAKRNNLQTDIDPGGVERDEEVQAKRDDATFLIELARRNNFECYIYVDEKGRDKLRFGASLPGKEHKLEWGRSLRSFVPTLTLSGQYNKVTVRGWDKDKKEVLVGVADLDSVKAKLGKDAPQEVARIAAAGRQEVVTGIDLKDQADADQKAHDILMSRIKVFTTGKALLIGRPDIRPGDTAHIAGVGKRFNGNYDVFKVEHTLDDKGFSTSIELRNHKPDKEAEK